MRNSPIDLGCEEEENKPMTTKATPDPDQLPESSTGIHAGELLPNGYRVIAIRVIRAHPAPWVTVLAYKPGEYEPYVTWHANGDRADSTCSGRYFGDVLAAASDFVTR